MIMLCHIYQAQQTTTSLRLTLETREQGVKHLRSPQ